MVVRRCWSFAPQLMPVMHIYPPTVVAVAVAIAAVAVTSCSWMQNGEVIVVLVVGLLSCLALSVLIYLIEELQWMAMEVAIGEAIFEAFFFSSFLLC